MQWTFFPHFYNYNVIGPYKELEVEAGYVLIWFLLDSNQMQWLNPKSVSSGGKD